jgi:hypothetical protein
VVILGLEVLDVAASAEEPEQLRSNQAERDLLRGNHGKTITEVVAVLVAEHAVVAFLGPTIPNVFAILKDMAEHFLILLHDFTATFEN